MGNAFSKLCSVAILGLYAGMASAQDQWVIAGLPDTIDIGPKQLFAIETSGPSAFDPDTPIREFGTGFAIAPTVIITAKHVTRRADEFVNKSGNDKIYIPAREVVLSYTDDETRTAERRANSDVWVTPSPLPTTDASRIDLDTLAAASFDLSVCAIEPGQQYYLLKFMQDDDGTAKNIRLPTAVPITAHTDVASRLGNLRRFEVAIPLQADNLRKPIGGDSGSPILDNQGRVIGLLTALQGSYLWVTPTQAFFDLVPPEMKSRVACNSEVTFDNLNTTEADLSARLDTLDSRYTGLKERVETEFASVNDRLADYVARIAELESQVVALESTDRQLADTDMQLLETDKKLVEADTQLGSNLKGSTAVLTAMVMEAADFPEDPKINEALKVLIERMSAVDPVIPAVAQMKKDLGAVNWGFSIDHKAASIRGPEFKISYERSISLPLVASQFVLCLRPMYDFREGVRPSSRADLDYTNIAFYAESEFIDVTGELMTECVLGGGWPQTDATKSAEYKMPINIDTRFSSAEFDVLDTASPPSRFFGYVFDGNHRYFDKPQSEREPLPILHRFIFEVDREDGKPRISCYHFPEKDLSDALESISLFLQATEPSEKDAQRCPTL